jgi:ADP-ribosylglycohydrolase
MPALTAGFARALQSLDGLSVADAFGQRFFRPQHIVRIPERAAPAAPWSWTDDTEMALSVVEELGERGAIDPDSLAGRFARRGTPSRGYGGGAIEWLRAVGGGAPWRQAAQALFGGQGSYGNGAAMRVAPLGAYFAGEPERAAEEARRSAEVTHAHAEGVAGAVAVAVAASLAPGAARGAAGRWLGEVARLTPPGPTREGIERASGLDPQLPGDAARILGTGDLVSSADTVPWALFCAAHHRDDYADALWTAVAGLGDRDTTCAIAGGIVALTAPVPPAWLEAREPLPALRLG